MIFAVILVDQAIKIWVKTSFWLGEEVVITDWFRLLFIENNGMAFGMELGSKLFLTIFRILAVAAIIWYIVRLCRRDATASTPIKRGYLVCWALIAAGAAGNIIDCVAYGQLFNDPMPRQVAEFMPPEGGYAPLFMGKVVDMFYFPLFSFDWPQWMPWVGGEHFLFFQPVFNFADASITVGIIALLIFYSGVFAGSSTAAPADPASESSHDNDTAASDK